MPGALETSFSPELPESVQRKASEREPHRIRAVQGQRRMGLSLAARRYRWGKAD